MEDIMRLIIIQIGTEYFGIDIFKIKKVISRPAFLSIQGKNSSDSSCVIGIMQSKNDYIPVIDLHSKFHTSQSSNCKLAIVIMLNENKIVLLVDNINSLVDVPHECIQPIPLTEKCKQCVSKAADYDGRLIPIIDIELLFRETSKDDL